MHRFARPTVFGLVTALGLLSGAHAVECADPAWTLAITQAMGRAPEAGECNAKLYGRAHTHQARVDAVRKVLGAMQLAGTNQVPTQKLPLKSVSPSVRGE